LLFRGGNMPSDEIPRNNLAALTPRNPALARSLQAAPFRRDCEIIPTRSGHFTARIAAPDGSAITLHGAYDPVKEAKQFVDAKNIGERENYLLMGFGLGYIAEEMLARLDKRRHVIILEADLSLLKTALSARDMAPLLSSEKILLHAGKDARLRGGEDVGRRG